jgi:hypothetical protein
MTIDNFVERSKGGQPTKYKGENHIRLLFDVFSEGEEVMAFCAKALISKNTFYDWLKAHEEFKRAYDIAVCLAGAWWESYPKNNPDFSFPYWSTIMRNRFGYGKPKVRIVKDAAPSARINAIWEGLEEGELSAQEASQLGSLVTIQENILKNQSQETEEFKRDTREELMEKIYAMQKIIDYADENKK